MTSGPSQEASKARFESEIFFNRHALSSLRTKCKRHRNQDTDDNRIGNLALAKVNTIRYKLLQRNCRVKCTLQQFATNYHLINNSDQSNYTLQL